MLKAGKVFRNIPYFLASSPLWCFLWLNHWRWYKSSIQPVSDNEGSNLFYFYFSSFPRAIFVQYFSESIVSWFKRRLRSFLPSFQRYRTGPSLLKIIFAVFSVFLKALECLKVLSCQTVSFFISFSTFFFFSLLKLQYKFAVNKKNLKMLKSI